MFIDCLREDGIAVVVAQARPRGVSSNYQKSAVGRVARREDEPAVYLAFESGLPVKDLKAVTQERRNVMQDVAPIRMEDGSCIGVLIAERDVTREVRREQKLRSLETREDAERLEPVPGGGDLVLREMNHRMKNQLQMLSSTIRIRSRSADSGQTRAELLTTAAEVDAIASAYDAMSNLDLVYAANKLRVTATCNTTIGRRGTLATRLQPNHATDDLEGITASLFEGLSYGSGDALIGLNPSGDTVSRLTEVLKRFDEIKHRFEIPTQICVLGHITTQIEAVRNGAPTDMYKTLISLKAGNAIVISPHPNARNCIVETWQVAARAAKAAGAPDGLIGCITTPTVEATNALLKHRDVGIILATGGEAMVRAAYSSGNPALGVGPGNGPSYIEKSADIPKAVSRILDSKTFDNGTICASEQSIVTDRCIADQVESELKRQGGWFMHIDFDEANASMADKNTTGQILR